MGYEFTADEIREAVTIARIYSPGLTEERFQASRELERRLQELGYLEAVLSLACLEQEKGVTGIEALDAFKQLLSDKERLGAEVASLEEGKILLQEENQQVEAATEQVKERLQALQAEHQKEEKELIAFKKKAERGKQHIDEELEEYQRKANVTKEEITGAAQLKSQLASRGFTIEFTLDLCQEFLGHENAKEELARAIEEHGTLTKSNAALVEQEQAQRKTLESGQAEIKSLEENRRQLGTIVSQLQADETFEKELRRFYHRYQSAGVLMEFLASWRDIFFVRCGNPLFAVTGTFAQSTSGALFWTEKRPLKRCPCCNYPEAFYDEKLYEALNLPVGEPYKLQLGQ